ncbi:MAG: amino acid ABC transporter ATP-binding protein [Acidimicrobiales bacterium]|nr:amino acid ABC transporter ATP-binding protein [Acidimicrobiales bacterium]
MQFGDLVAVDDVSLTVDRGEVVAIIGPSGAGKSSFLRCLNLLETPTRGRIRVGDFTLQIDAGQPAPKAREVHRLRSHFGMVFQGFNLFPHLTALENISLAQRRVLGRPQDESDSRSRELLERVGLAEKALSYPGHCSGGQQQRIAIARALALEPAVMLFDEPTSALDPEIGLEVLQVMRELADEGVTMVVVTHELAFARDVSDRIVVMVSGAILEEGPPAQLLRHPQHARTRKFLSAVLDR